MFASNANGSRVLLLRTSIPLSTLTYLNLNWYQNVSYLMYNSFIPTINITFCWNHSRYISSEGTQSSSRRSSRLHSGGDSDSYNKTDEESCAMKTDEEDNELYDRDPQVRRFRWMARHNLFSIWWQDVFLSSSGKTWFIFHLEARHDLVFIGTAQLGVCLCWMLLWGGAVGKCC